MNSNDPKTPDDIWAVLKSYKLLIIYIAVIVTLQIVLRIMGWE